MDSIQVIQHFFAKMRCNYCHSHFQPQGISLVREEEDVFIVDVSCAHCERHAGLAMVSLDRNAFPNLKPRFKDPELTPDELERLSAFEPISDNDVLDAHHFFQNMESNWQKYLQQNLNENAESAVETDKKSLDRPVQQAFDFNL